MFKIDFTDLSYDARWYEFGESGARLKIRPYPLSQAVTVIQDGGLRISGAEQCRLFKHCLVAWEGVVGADEKPLPCTDEVKQKIYDFNLGGLAAFVLAKDREFRQAKDALEKN
jgi:hypothetical protein